MSSHSEDPVQEIHDEDGSQPEWLNSDEGFSSNFPKRLPDDCVEYTLFLIDNKLSSDFARREKLKTIQNAGNAMLKSAHLEEYIWQREKFHLDLVDSRLGNTTTKSAKSAGDAKDKVVVQGHDFYLHGQTNFGDSIADEWLIVYFLLELSNKFPTLWLQVRDPDGEFLLAEAANALPKWLEPELADNRVWIHRGQLQIIPLQRNAADGAHGPTTPGLPGNVSISQALDFLKKTPHSTLHSPLIEAEAFYRLRTYPDSISSSQHNALLSLPRRLAWLLHQNPSYVSPAIESFYLRDPIAVRPLTTKDVATLAFPPEDFVTTSVRFPKVGYAQLHSQQFPPPPAWVGITPHLKDQKVEMGMKLACGFEMLVADPQMQDKTDVREIKVLLEDLEAGDEQLPTDKEISAWEKKQDDDKWLDIDFKDFDDQLKGSSRGDHPINPQTEKKKGVFEDETSTHKDLKDMVSRFEQFLNEDEEDSDGSDASSTSHTDSENEDDDDEEEDKAASFTPAEFETAMREMMGMPDWEKETSGLKSEARELALEMEDEEEMERDEEEEVKFIMERMKELMEERKKDKDKNEAGDKGKGKEKETETEEKNAKGHAAPEYNARGDPVGPFASMSSSSSKNTDKGKGKAVASFADAQDSEEEIEGFHTIDDESDDEDVLGSGLQDADYELLKNMLESFKGQGGVQGPAGNIMGLMGMGRLPRDED